MITALALIATSAVLFTWALTSRRAVDEDNLPPHVKAWQQAVADEHSAVGRILLSVARPFTTLPALEKESASSGWRSLQRKVLAAGVFSGSVEVYLAVQAAALLLGGVALALTAYAAASGGDTFAVVAGVLFAVTISAYPWNLVSKAARRREDAVMEGLPDFAELLQMPLSAGMGILPALAFTAERGGGVVAGEVQRMVSYVRNNAREEVTAFRITGERLATPEAKAFFATLLQAHMEGAKVAAQLARQADGLRTAAYQRRRAKIKRLPLRLVMIFAVHLLPLLFILALLPTFVSLGQL